MYRTLLLLITLFMGTQLFALSITPIDAQDKESKLSNYQKHYFGEELFHGNFKNNAQFHEDPNYVLKTGDVISIKIWGAYDFVGDVPIDKQGNIFIPQVGTAKLKGLKSKELQPELSSAIKEVFNDNVNIYATVQGYQPLSVFVSGSVNKVGLYDGFSTDSVLQYIDKAGGIIRGEGSYRDIVILRSKRTVKHIDLYSFLLKGNTSSFRFKNGDVILVRPLKTYVEAEGDVSRPYIFEFTSKHTHVHDLLKYVLPKPGVNQFIHTKRQNGKEISKRYGLRDSKHVHLHKGDKVTFFSNQYIQSISVAIEGEHKGLRYMTVAKGTSLYTVLKKVRFSPLSNIKSTQLFRNSIRKSQQALLDTKLQDLEARALTTDSATAEEAAIRSKEAALILKFIERAKKVKLKGQLVLSAKADLRMTILEDGDRIFIPKKTNVVMVQGEVNIPNALSYKTGKTLRSYTDACGGFTDRANTDKILLIKANGRAMQYTDGFLHKSPRINAGDSILVLGKTDTKTLLFAKDITQIIYQVAVGAAVILRAF